MLGTRENDRAEPRAEGHCYPSTVGLRIANRVVSGPQRLKGRRIGVRTITRHGALPLVDR